jgi:hypothetical protein
MYSVFIIFSEDNTLGQGSYVICEMDSVQKEYPSFQQAMRQLEAAVLQKSSLDWGQVNAPKPFGKLAATGNQFGRTTILPALFDNHSAVQMVTWRQLFTVAGHQTIMAGCRAGNTIPEDFKIGLMGFAFPNKNQHLTEIKMQIGDRKLGRINLEELLLYNKPAVIFEEGYMIDEEEAFDLYGYIEGPIPTHHDGYVGVHQRIVPIGFCTYRVIDKVLGNCGAAI